MAFGCHLVQHSKDRSMQTWIYSGGFLSGRQLLNWVLSLAHLSFKVVHVSVNVVQHRRLLKNAIAHGFDYSRHGCILKIAADIFLGIYRIFKIISFEIVKFNFRVQFNFTIKMLVDIYQKFIKLPWGWKHFQSYFLCIYLKCEKTSSKSNYKKKTTPGKSR